MSSNNHTLIKHRARSSSSAKLGNLELMLPASVVQLQQDPSLSDIRNRSLEIATARAFPSRVFFFCESL